MSLDAIATLWPVLLVVVNGVYSHLTARGKANESKIIEIEAVHTGEINGLRGELSNIKERMSVLEATSSQLPKHSDLTRLDGRVTSVAKSVSEIKGEIKAGNRLLDNIHKVLLAERGE
ncbi:MAG: hypothetical protein OXG81_11910 [Acidobacteria bacterium]|nr:hypothetical protein [Acidobacteriota bacterium]